MFIILTDADEHDDVFLNVHQIEAFYAEDRYSVVRAKSNASYSVTETVEEIAEKILDVAAMADGLPAQKYDFTVSSVESPDRLITRR